MSSTSIRKRDVIAALLSALASSASAQPVAVAFTVQPSSVTAGAAITPSVEVSILDNQGRIERQATNTVVIALGANPGGATLAGQLSVAAVRGVATFTNLWLDKSGAGYTLTATSGVLTGATSAVFSVVAGQESRIAFISQPNAATAGIPFNPTVRVQVQDTYGNAVTDATNLVTVALNPNPTAATLFGTTAVAPSAGTAQFSDMFLTRAGIGYGLTATYPGLPPINSAVFNVVGGLANRLSFATQPVSVEAGAVIGPPAVQVAIEDPYGNPVGNATNSVTVSLGANPSGATLGGVTSAQAIGGTATLPSLTIDRAGVGYTLVASATGLTGVTSNSFTITPGVATGLIVYGPSAGSSIGGTFGSTVAGAVMPAVEVRVVNSSGGIVGTSGLSVTLGLGSNPTGATLQGTLNALTNNGVARFTDLVMTKVNAPTNYYKFQATGGGFTSPLSGGFSVRAAAPSKIAFLHAMPATREAWIAGRIYAEFLDAYDNRTDRPPAGVTQATISLANNPTGDVLRGTLTVPFPSWTYSGQTSYSNTVTFEPWLALPGTGYTLKVDAGAYTSAPSTPFAVTLTFKSVSAGGNHSCALSMGSRAYCWGHNTSGQLGTGDFTASLRPTLVNPDMRWLHLDASQYGFTCAIKYGAPDAEVPFCWGRDPALGGSVSNTPRKIPGAPAADPYFSKENRVASGQLHACFARYKRAGTLEQDVYCWGKNIFGATGTGTAATLTLSSATKANVPQARYTDVTAGSTHTCALTADFDGYCWGSNASGRTGTGTSNQVQTPALILGGFKWKQLAAGTAFTCGIDNTSKLVTCFGNNAEGQLGTATPTITNFQIPATTFASISAGGAHACGITGTPASTIMCWGSNSHGQLGTGTVGGTALPTQLSVAGVSFASVSAGLTHTCAISTVRDIYCWGDNPYGQLGLGNTTPMAAPTKLTP